MSFMWRYFFATMTIFFIAPELRRMQDMVLGYSQFEIWSILPSMMLIPFFYVVGMHDRYKRIPEVFAWMAWLWVGGFTYALFMSYIANNFAAGLLTYTQFVLPLGAGLWLVTEQLPYATVYHRITKYLFTIATWIAVYGIIQWIVIPPWEAQWLANIKASAFGNPVPFQLRAFSTMNSPGTFANTMASIAILALPRVILGSWKFRASYISWIIALGVTSVRTSWIEFLLGAIVYFVLTRRFKQLISVIAFATCATVAVSYIAPDSPIVTTIGDRASSLTDVQGDLSYNQRSELYVEMIPKVFETPMGMGLGVFGNGGKMSDVGMQIDSGILSRLLEMGWPGTAALLLTLFIALNVPAIQMFRGTQSIRLATDTYASIIGMQIGFLFLETSGDVHLGIFGLLFWITLAPMCLPTPLAQRVSTRTQSQLSSHPKFA